MTDEPKDYEKMYNDLKTEYDSVKSKVDDMQKSIDERNKKITDLQIYIADNMVISKKTDNPDIPKSFDDIYNKTLKEMKNKKD